MNPKTLNALLVRAETATKFDTLQSVVVDLALAVTQLNAVVNRLDPLTPPGLEHNDANL